MISLSACRKHEPAPLKEAPFTDAFERSELGDAWQKNPAPWRIADGQLQVSGARNRCLWANVRLPQDAVVELTARSEDPDGDIKLILYGDGKDYRSGYSLIFGGWQNTISIIGRLGEHGDDRKEREDFKVEPGHTYRMKAVRSGKDLRWFIDDRLFMDYYDAEPLGGRGHERFAFCNWQTRIHFDDLKIRKATPEDMKEATAPPIGD